MSDHLYVCRHMLKASTVHFFGMQMYLQNLPVKFIYQGHRFKDKVTEAKKSCWYCMSTGFRQRGVSPLCSWVVCLRLKKAACFAWTNVWLCCAGALQTAWIGLWLVQSFITSQALRLLLYMLAFNFSMMIVTIYVLKPFHSYTFTDAIDTSPPTLCLFTTFKPSQKKMPVFNFYDILSSK